MNRRFIAGAIALVIAGCSTGANSTSSPGSTAAASPAAFVPSVAPTATIEPTVAPEPTAEPERTYGPCPTTAIISAKDFVLADPDCFETGDIQIRGWLDDPTSFGVECPCVEPGWLWYPMDVPATLWFDVPSGDEFFCNQDVDAWCYSFWLHRPPDSTLKVLPLKRWVILTGHTHDPAAETCHYNDGVSQGPDLIAGCRSNFVVTGIRAAP